MVYAGVGMMSYVVWADRSTLGSFWVPSLRLNFATACTGEQKGITLSETQAMHYHDYTGLPN